MFVLVNKKTGVILRAEARDTSRNDECNNMSFTLNEKVGMPFLALTKDQAEKVLNKDSRWYNSSEAHPCHGSIKADEYEIKELAYV